MPQRRSFYPARFSPTLSLYIGWQFILAFAALLVGIAGLILLFDTVELMKRSVRADVGMGTLLDMAFLKLPHTSQATLPFVVMIAMMFALFRLSRSYELVVIRSAGLSVWQFLAPPLLLAAVIGAVNLMVVDPLSASMYESYQRMEDSLIRQNATTLKVGEGGLWMRESDGQVATTVFAGAVHQEGGVLYIKDVSIFVTEDKQKLDRRIEAESGALLGGHFKLDQVWDIVPPQGGQFSKELQLPTHLTIDQVQDSFAAPETMSFWELPTFIRFSQNAGFSALPHRLYWQSLLASPFLLCAMVLVAAAFYLTTQARWAGWTMRGVSGVATGFVLYFFSKFTYALGLSATLPLALAAWAPTGVAGMLGLAYLFHREDG